MLKWIIDFFFPPKCPFCGKIVQDSFAYCGECTLPQSHDYFLVGDGLWCYAPFWYEGKAKEALLRYKFSGLRQYAPCFGRLMADNPLSRQPFDYVSWAPLSAKRRRQRGYDQAELLARALAKELGLEAKAILRKRKDTKAQSSLLDEDARFENAKDVYTLGEVDVRGANILLVDDVITTGATMLSCYEVLKQAGAGTVAFVSLARGKTTEKFSPGYVAKV